MPRYRVGDKYLSEEEYKEYEDENLGCLFAFIGTVLTGILLFIFCYKVGIESKIIKFLLIVPASILAGGIMHELRNQIVKVLGIVLGVGFIILIFWGIWSIL